MQEGADRGTNPNKTGTQPKRRTKSPGPTPGRRDLKAAAGRGAGQPKHAADKTRGLKTSRTRKAGRRKTPRGTTTRSGDK
jgi:hypothetical protein